MSFLQYFLLFLFLDLVPQLRGYAFGVASEARQDIIRFVTVIILICAYCAKFISYNNNIRANHSRTKNIWNMMSPLIDFDELNKFVCYFCSSIHIWAKAIHSKFSIFICCFLMFYIKFNLKSNVMFLEWRRDCCVWRSRRSSPASGKSSVSLSHRLLQRFILHTVCLLWSVKYHW